MAFKESEHPRDKDGKFTDGQNGSEGQTAEEIAKEIFPHLTGERKLVKIDLQFFTEEAIQTQSTASIKKGIRSLKSHIERHQRKIKNPALYDANWSSKSEREKVGLIKHWEKEIRNSTESIERRIAELRKRGEYDGT